MTLEASEFNSTNEYVSTLQNKLRYSYQLVRQNLNRKAERRKHYYDWKVRPKKFEENQFVYYFSPRKYINKCGKWARNYSGPFLITRMIGPVNAVIQRSKQSKPMVVHVDKSKHYKRDDVKSWLLLPNVVPEVIKETDNSQDPNNSTLVEPELQMLPVEDSSDLMAQMPTESNDTINPKDSEEAFHSSGETEVFPARRPVRNRQKPARYRD